MAEHNGQMKRNLKTRHVSMIALGGSIGTGLFVASGVTVAQAGPSGAIVAYLAIGVMVYFLMTSLGDEKPIRWEPWFCRWSASYFVSLCCGWLLVPRY